MTHVADGGSSMGLAKDEIEDDSNDVRAGVRADEADHIRWHFHHERLQPRSAAQVRMPSRIVVYSPLDLASQSIPSNHLSDSDPILASSYPTRIPRHAPFLVLRRACKRTPNPCSRSLCSSRVELVPGRCCRTRASKRNMQMRRAASGGVGSPVELEVRVESERPVD
jgi:hypothetical protein